jgi:hypothetical protein
VARRWADEPRISYHRWPSNRGLGRTLNEGLRLADTDVIAYLPSDDVWYPDHLARVTTLLADTEVTLAWSGVRHHQDQVSLDAPDGFPLQLVQVAHRRTPQRWPERDELESDDLEMLFWRRLRGGTCGGTGTVTCEWTDHPRQRHKAMRESFDGGLNVFRRRYRVADPLRFHSSDSGTVDEIRRYRLFRERSYPRTDSGLKILLVGELAFNPERVLALAERGHALFGLWTDAGLGDSTVGPMPFGHVQDLPRDGWRSAVRNLAPDVIYAQLNWRAVPFAHEVMTTARDVPFVWHFKEAPQRSIVRGEWRLLAELVLRSDRCIVATEEERTWFQLALPEVLDRGELVAMDGDLPKQEWLAGQRSRKLSERDGQIHTVVLGRPLGLDPEFLVALAREGVHTHFHGQVTGPGRVGGWQTVVGRACAEAPGHVHLHPAIDPEGWVGELSRYDAGWLHRFHSHNRGDLRRATWDELNSPARLPVLLAAGVPPVVQANRGHAVAVQRILEQTETGIVFDDVADLVHQLHTELGDRARADRAWTERHRFTFDAQADRLGAILGDAASRSPGRPRGSTWAR